MINQKQLFSLFLIFILIFSSISTSKIVSAESSKVKISQTSAIVIEGDYLYLSMKGTNQKVTWTSSNNNIASVTADGKVSSNSTGQVTIIAKVAGKKYTCIVAFIPNIDPNYLTDRDVETALAQRDYIDNIGNDDTNSKKNTKGLPSKKTINTKINRIGSLQHTLFYYVHYAEKHIDFPLKNKPVTSFRLRLVRSFLDDARGD